MSSTTGRTAYVRVGEAAVPKLRRRPSIGQVIERQRDDRAIRTGRPLLTRIKVAKEGS